MKILHYTNIKRITRVTGGGQHIRADARSHLSHRALRLHTESVTLPCSLTLTDMCAFEVACCCAYLCARSRLNENLFFLQLASHVGITTTSKGAFQNPDILLGGEKKKSPSHFTHFTQCMSGKGNSWLKLVHKKLKVTFLWTFIWTIMRSYVAQDLKFFQSSNWAILCTA